MVAVIKAGHSLSRILRYNEEKVKNGAARFLGEANCPFDGATASTMSKLRYMESIAALNTRVTSPSVHISLNFPPAEENLQDSKMLEIARSYMEQIGFGAQPFLAYRHTDAGHPHLHLVSLKIRPDGSRIDMHNIGRNQSEKARHTIEATFGLTPADNANGLGLAQQPISAPRLAYGKAPTKQAIGKIVQYAMQQYHFKSLPEFNALLGLYNIAADRGKVTSRTYIGGGLLYKALDTQGNPVGVPIKASDFYFKPTLQKLEVFFNKQQQQGSAYDHLKTAMDSTLIKKKCPSLLDLQDALKPLGVDMVLRSNAQGYTYGITFIDHTTRVVCNGSSLGKQYSAKGLEIRCKGHLREDALRDQPSVVKAPQHHTFGNAAVNGPDVLAQHIRPGENSGITDNLLNPELLHETGSPWYGARKKKKKRKGGR